MGEISLWFAQMFHLLFIWNMYQAHIQSNAGLPPTCLKNTSLPPALPIFAALPLFTFSGRNKIRLESHHFDHWSVSSSRHLRYQLERKSVMPPEYFRSPAVMWGEWERDDQLVNSCIFYLTHFLQFCLFWSMFDLSFRIHELLLLSHSNFFLLYELITLQIHTQRVRKQKRNFLSAPRWELFLLFSLGSLSLSLTYSLSL